MQEICVTVLKYIYPIATDKSYITFLPAVLLTAGIAVLSLAEASSMPSVALNDKLIHGLMYAFLAVAWVLPLQKYMSSPLRANLLVWICVTAYGSLMEMLQRFCTLSRSGDMADLYADALGALIGLSLIAMLKMKKGK